MLLEGVALLLVFIVLALALTIAGIALRNMALTLSATGAWVITGVYSYSQSTVLWDIHFALFWLCLGIAIVCVLSGASMRSKKEEEIEEDQDLKQWANFESSFGQFDKPFEYMERGTTLDSNRVVRQSRRRKPITQIDIAPRGR